ncbi:MAG: hypothetical protein GY696_31360, partial [Gammaproteobacteria bacterium]|nr:hypothetical protein [Gammaproteobacteria bacterium]
MSLLGLEDMGKMELVIDTRTRSIYRARQTPSSVPTSAVFIAPSITHPTEAPHAVSDSEHRSRLLSELKDQFPGVFSDSSKGNEKKGFENVIALKPETISKQ